MTKNMGKSDKYARIGLAIIGIGLLLSGVATGLPGIFLAVISGALVLTSVVGICPLYIPFKLSTIGKFHTREGSPDREQTSR